MTLLEELQSGSKLTRLGQYNELTSRYLQTIIIILGGYSGIKLMLKYEIRAFFGQIVKNHFTHTLSQCYPYAAIVHLWHCDYRLLLSFYGWYLGKTKRHTQRAQSKFRRRFFNAFSTFFRRRLKNRWNIDVDSTLNRRRNCPLGSELALGLYSQFDDCT